METYFRVHRQVVPSEIDGLGHVNNIVYLTWMVDAATGHSESVGWPLHRYLEEGFGWVVRSHTIHYRRPAFVDDQVEVVTWIAAMTRVTCLRRYRVIRVADGVLLAEGSTEWAFVDYKTGVPRRIAEVILRDYPIPTEELPP